jgi:hypothetical protein
MNVSRLIKFDPHHALVVAANRLLTATPAIVKLKMTAANSNNQPQYWGNFNKLLSASTLSLSLRFLE